MSSEQMETQIKQAVEIAISGSQDGELKNQAIQFLNNVKESPDGWQVFLLLLKNEYPEQVRFIALQAVNDAIAGLAPDQLHFIRTTLFEYLLGAIKLNSKDESYFRNKLASSFALLFCSCYLTSWPGFFTDLHGLIKDKNPVAVDYYLRILLAIHSEIGDQLIIRERSVVDRNNNLKDAIRANDMKEMTLVWKDLLQSFKSFEPAVGTKVVDNTLKIIGGYVSWIEISLIVGNNDYIELILQFLNEKTLRNTCCETLAEIISKKMKPENKLQLLSILNITSYISHLNLDNNDLEFVETTAKLYNAIGLELTYIVESTESAMDVKSEADKQLTQLFPYILEFLGNIYDDVSIQVFPFITNYLACLKKLLKQNLLTDVHTQILLTLLQKIIIKMKYDDEDDGDDEDSISEFNEFRSKLKVFQDTIALINPELYLDQVTQVINESIFANKDGVVVKSKDETDWRPIELGLFELTNLSESVKNNIFNIPKLQVQSSKPYLIFHEIFLKLINSNVLTINHPLVQLLFFELIIRHYNFFSNNNHPDNKHQDLVNSILNYFLTFGLYNSNEKVQLRCWYLFFRFTKLIKPVFDDELILKLITNLSNDLLVIKAELPMKDEDDEIVEVSSKFDNQLYLFESLGLLISLINNDKIMLKLKLFDIVINPIFSDLEKIIKLLQSSEQQQLVLQAHHSLMAIGTIARGFEYDSQPNKKYPDEIILKFNNVAEVVLFTLESLSKYEIIRDAARFSFARFIPILKNNINSYLTRLISIILASNNLKFNEMTDFLGFIGQIVHNFKDDENTFQLLNELFSPLMSKVFTMLNDKGENDVYELMPDVKRDKLLLKKAFILLLQGLILNNISSLLITNQNKANLPIILEFLLNESNELNLQDLNLSKISINTLALLTNIFGNDAINDQKDKFGAGLKVEGISSFLLENLVKLSFELPFKNTKFNIADAQFRFVSDELANLLKTLYLVRGQDLANYLKSIYFIEIQLPANIGDELISNLVSLDAKQFKKYFVSFIVQFK